MKKYTVNYTRQFPDHRVGHDFKLYEQISASPIQLFRVDGYKCRYGKQGSI